MTINNYNFTSLNNLASDMYLNPTYYLSLLSDNEILSIVKSESEIKYKQICELFYTPEDDDIIAFKASYILNPLMEFKYRGYKFNALKQLGYKIFEKTPNVNTVLINVINKNLISYYLENSTFTSEESFNIDEIKKIEQSGKDNLLYAYYSMAYYLTKSEYFYFDNMQYKDIHNFAYFYLKSNKNISALGEYLPNSEYLRAYFDYTSRGLELRDFFHFSESQQKQKRQLNDFILKKKKDREEKIVTLSDDEENN